jgi:hypothetical protein
MIKLVVIAVESRYSLYSFFSHEYFSILELIKSFEVESNLH